MEKLPTFKSKKSALQAISKMEAFILSDSEPLIKKKEAEERMALLQDLAQKSGINEVASLASIVRSKFRDLVARTFPAMTPAESGAMKGKEKKGSATEAVPFTDDQIEKWRAIYNPGPKAKFKLSQEEIEGVWAEYDQKKEILNDNVFKMLLQRKKGKQAHFSGKFEWYTPATIIEAARETMGSIDLDPASSEKANKIVKADVFFNEEQEGQHKEWTGNVWLNPPYSRGLIDLFVERLVKEYERDDGVTQAIVIVNNSTEVGWAQELFKISMAVCFPAGRVKFIDGDTSEVAGTPIQGQVIFGIGVSVEEFTENFEKFGHIFRS